MWAVSLYASILIICSLIEIRKRNIHREEPAAVYAVTSTPLYPLNTLWKQEAAVCHYCTTLSAYTIVSSEVCVCVIFWC